ncbi:MAG: hypothetical protein JOZ01_00385, partial [Candidatus Eremiobacteraeota bacterium]|nr:hypothetical protein [Candidatus Eremiobacteraeota bacterium]
AVRFTSLSGLGAIIMVGSIVLPIMMTTGVPRTIAATMFLMSFALGFIFNLTNWKFYTQLFGVVPQQLAHFAIVLAIVDALALLVYAMVAFRRERGYAAWAVAAKRERDLRVPAVALLTPILPIVLYFALHLDAMLAFAISAIFGVLVTRPRKAIPTLVAAAIRGVEDVAPAVLLFIGIGMLLAATKAPQLAAALQPLVASGWVANPIAFVALFGILSPLTLYRGPLNPFGVGIAIFTVLLTSHALPPLVLVAAIMAVVQVQNVCDPTNTANVWVANFTAVPIDTITKRTLPYQVAVATIATIVVVAASVPLFGTKAFASSVEPAMAAAILSGLTAPSAARGRIAVDNDGSRLSRAAAAAAIAGLRTASLDAFALHDDPNAHDCTSKPYTAYVYVTTSTFTVIEGVDLDVGVRLEDCGGWIVNEWHDHEISPQATDDAARHLAAEGCARLRSWIGSSNRGAALLSDGLAVAPGDPPTYYFTLFKTVDGNMRAYVRAGGPAYASGLRTNDIVDKLDGKFWWEYGTYQTQLRAFDGQPHSFEVERQGKTVDVQLGDPFVPSKQE